LPLEIFFSPKKKGVCPGGGGGGLFNVFTKNRIMIVENMSIEEMQIEVEKDSDILYAKIRHLYDDI